MKTGIKKGLCLIIFVLALVMMTVPLMAAAKTGHGGTTLVIARVTMPSDSQSEEPSPESSQPESSEEQPTSSEGQPVDTGEAIPWFISAAVVFSLALMIVLRKDSKKDT